MASLVQMALAYRRRQAFLGARMMRNLARAWRDLVNPARVDDTWPTLERLLAAEVEQARAESARLAADSYLQARRAAGIPDDAFVPPAALELAPERLQRTLQVTGPVEFKKAITAGKSPQQAVDTAAVRMAGSTQYLALEAGREVMQRAIDRDERATGWSRVTDTDPCAWCAMLASRGPVYKSERAAGRDQNRRFIGDGEFKYHDHCGCTAWPAFTLNEPFVGIAEDLYDAWLQHTRGYGGKDAVNAFRRWWEAEGRAAYTSPRSEGR